MLTKNKERPILFNGEMARAILDGRKTQTRRVIKLNGSGRVKEVGSCRNWHLDDPDAVLACPYGKPGDRLWVRETWSASSEHMAIHRPYPDSWFWYRADNDRPTWAEGRWKPSIHMPRWASRILLEVVSVRVERVQMIGPIDCFAEGCMPIDQWPRQKEVVSGTAGEGVIEAYKQSQSKEVFKELWDSINDGRGFGWGVNPRVWAVEFKVIEGGSANA